MKRLYTILFLLFAFVANSYGQKMSVETFSMDENDMEARVYSPRKDQNGFTAALIKIETSERDLAFDTGGMGIVDTDFTQVGEVWVYVPKGVIRMDIKHNLFGVLRYEFPIPIKEATVYKMKLTSSRITQIINEDAGGNYLALKCMPEDIEISIDGGVPRPITEGGDRIFLSYGEHTYTATADLYKSETGTIRITESGRTDLEINLAPNYGYISVNSTPTGADVKLNGILMGKTPYKSDKMTLGEYTLQISMANYAPVEQRISLDDDNLNVVIDPTLVSYLSPITIKCAAPDAEILLNEESKGVGSWSGDLLPGTYEVKAIKEGYRSSVRALVVARSTPQEITLNAPTPMYGRLNVDAEQMDVMVYLDGKELGDAPNIFSNILVGRHEVTFKKSGYVSHTEEVEIREGAISRVTVDDLKAEAATSLAERAKEREQAKQPRETKQPREVKQPSERASVESRIFVLPQIGFGAGTVSYGAMAGWANRLGGYAKVLSSFQSIGANMNCNNDGVTSNGLDSKFTQDGVKVDHMSATAGVLCRATPWLYIYGGGGYCYRYVGWQLTSGEYAKNIDLMIDGSYSLDVGAVARFGGFSVSMGLNTIETKYSQVNIGVGFNF